MNRNIRLKIGESLVLLIYILLHAIVFVTVNLFYHTYRGYIDTQGLTVTISSSGWSEPLIIPMSLLYTSVVLGGCILGVLALCLSVAFVVEFWRKRISIPRLWWYKALVTGKWRE